MRLVQTVLLFFILLLQLNFCRAQDSLPRAEPKFSQRQKLIIAGLTAQQAASVYLEYKWWWENNYHPLHHENDGGFNNYSLGIDKVGHFYTSYMYSNLLYELMQWGKFSKKSSDWVSVILPFAWALSIELGDGFSKYAFSSHDLLANSIGIAYALAERKVKVLENFKFKYSYYPSKYFLDKNMKGWSLVSDYDGHIYWLSIDIYGLLPIKLKPYWPKYINIAGGYGMFNFRPLEPFTEGPPHRREFHIGLDFNLNRLPAKKQGWKTFLKMADHYHLPAPGFSKVSPDNWQFRALILR